MMPKGRLVRRSESRGARRCKFVDSQQHSDMGLICFACHGLEVLTFMRVCQYTPCILAQPVLSRQDRSVLLGVIEFVNKRGGVYDEVNNM